MVEIGMNFFSFFLTFFDITLIFKRKNNTGDKKFEIFFKEWFFLWNKEYLILFYCKIYF